MIRWKVVTKQRNSVSMVLRFNQLGKYAREYPVGKTVSAEKDSFGLMTFRTKKQAMEFFNDWGEDRVLIIKVDGIGKGKVPKTIFTLTKDSAHLLDLYSKYELHNNRTT